MQVDQDASGSLCDSTTNVGRTDPHGQRRFERCGQERPAGPSDGMEAVEWNRTPLGARPHTGRKRKENGLLVLSAVAVLGRVGARRLGPATPGSAARRRARHLRARLPSPPPRHAARWSIRGTAGTSGWVASGLLPAAGSRRARRRLPGAAVKEPNDLLAES